MKITLAALLHDIGKFYQRTGVKLGNKELYSRYSKNNSYIHACYTSKFIDEELKIKFEPLSELIDESAGHHNSKDGIVKEADIIASGHDRKDAKKEEYAEAISEEEINEESYKTTRLYSIFNEIKTVDSQRNELEYLNLNSLFNLSYKKENNITIEEAEKEYKKLFDAFIADMNNINFVDMNNYTRLHHLMYPIIKNYTVTIPANTMSNFPTVSLYEHLKLTAAIAVCIEKDPENPPFVIFDYDVSGIQSFIYKIAEGGENKEKIAKNLRTRSLYLSLLADFVAYYIIKEFNLSYENVLYSSSGRGRLLLPNIKDFDIKIKDICDTIETELYKLHNGNLGIIFSYSKLDGKELQELNLSDYKKEDRINRINSKNKKFKKMIADKNFKFINQPFKKVCSMCQIQEAKNDTCEFCNNMLDLNDQVLSQSNDFVVEFKYKELTTQSDYTIKIGNLGYIDFYLNFNNKYINDDSFYLSMNSYKVGEIKTYAMSLNKKISFPDIAKYNHDNNIKGDDKIAVIKMDVDNLGYIFMKGLEGERENKVKNGPNDKNTISKSLNLSRSLDMFFTSKLPEICGKYAYINYAGGDDLVVVVPASIALDTVEKINHEFHKWTQNNASFTISAGIDIFECNSPIRYAIARADHMLDMSKDEEDKNSFTVLNVSLSNTILSDINEEVKKYEEAINKGILSRGAIYDIYSALLMSLDDTNNIKNRYMSFIPHIAYSIKRNVSDNEWNNILKETFVFSNIDIALIKKYKVVLGIALMNTREEKENE